VTVQAGEGTTEIIYGSRSIPAGARTLGGYIARPDRVGDFGVTFPHLFYIPKRIKWCVH